MHTVVWCETVKGKDHLKTLAQTGKHGVDSSTSGNGPIAAYCECYIKPAVSTKCMMGWVTD
jgi:hypothetical protein